MTDQSPDAVRHALAEAALTAAAGTPWRDLTLRDVAVAGDVPFDVLALHAPDRRALVGLVCGYLDREAAKALDVDLDATARERAFDAGMALFDAMEGQRDGVVSLLRAADQDIGLRTRLGRSLSRTSRLLLELAGFSTAGFSGAARAQGFAYVLARTMPAWRKDEDADLSRTMAQLDRSLRDAEEFMGRFRRRRRSDAEMTSETDGPAPIRPRDKDVEPPAKTNGEGRTPTSAEPGDEDLDAPLG